jgi:hypothetical protein
MYLNAIFKDNAAVNCVTVQHKRYIPANCEGSCYGNNMKSNIQCILHDD